MKLFVLLDDELTPAIVGKTHADARVFHRAGKADRLSGLHRLVERRLHGLQRLDKSCLRAHDLPIRQHTSRTDRVAVADFPRADADFLRHFVEQALNCKARLRHAEAAERARRGIVRIIRAALDLKVFIGVGACRVGAGPLENGAAEGRKRAGIGHDLRLYALNDAVFIAADRKVHPERVPLGMYQQGLCS